MRAPGAVFLVQVTETYFNSVDKPLPVDIETRKNYAIGKSACPFKLVFIALASVHFWRDSERIWTFGPTLIADG